MTPADRKAALARYAERKPQRGIYALRCAPSGECWVGASSALDSISNRHRFDLEMGTHPSAALQAVAAAHGIGAIRFDVHEMLAADTPQVALARLLKDRLAHWAGELNARRL